MTMASASPRLFNSRTVFNAPLARDGFSGGKAIAFDAYVAQKNPDKVIYFVDQEPPSSGQSWVVRRQRFDQRDATEVARLRYPLLLGAPAPSASRPSAAGCSPRRARENPIGCWWRFR